MLLGVIGAILIIITAPAKSSSQGETVPTAQPDQSNHMSVGNIGGQIVFSRQGYLWRWRGDNANRLPLDPGNSVVANNRVKLVEPALSRDGTKLAFVRQDESFSDLWTANADGTNGRPLSADKGDGTPRSPDFTSSSLWSFTPAWSPDGTEIAFLSDVKTDDLTLWVTPASRLNRRSLSKLAVGQGGILSCDWSYQGDDLVVAAYQNGKSQIYTINASTGAPSQLTDLSEGAYDPAWSPDGSSIAFVARHGNSSELRLMRADGSATVTLSGLNARSPVWSPDGKKIAFLSFKDGGFEVFSIDVNANGTGAASDPKQLTSGAKLDGTDGLTWSR